MNNFVRTIAINKILAMTKRKKIIQGGTSFLLKGRKNI